MDFSFKSGGRTGIVYKRKDKITMLGTFDIAPNPLQPRKHFDEGEIRSLAESIRQFGIIQPITVKPFETMPFPYAPSTAKYEIIAGERRWRAARLLGIAKLPCIIVETDRSGSAMLALIENIQRKDLSFFEEAAALQNLLLMTSMTQQELARRLSMSQSAISNKLRLLKLSENERGLIIENNLCERHARAALRLPDERMRRLLLTVVIERSLSADETERLAEDWLRNGVPVDPLPEDASERPESAPEPPEKQEKCPPETGRRRIGVIKDIRFFFNTLDRAVNLLSDAGISAKSVTRETSNGYEIVVTIPKREARP